jgi:hypothetical protein
MQHHDQRWANPFASFFDKSWRPSEIEVVTWTGDLLVRHENDHRTKAAALT